MKRAILILQFLLTGLVIFGLISSAGCGTNSSGHEAASPAPPAKASSPNESSAVKPADIVEGETVAADMHGADHRKQKLRSEGSAQIPEHERRKIYTALVALELQGLSCADACVVVAKEYGISVDAAGKISVEGVEKKWPNQ